MNQNSNPAGNPQVGEPHVADEQAPVRGDESELAQFERLADKLVRVPKQELDEKRQEA